MGIEGNGVKIKYFPESAYHLIFHIWSPSFFPDPLNTTFGLAKN